MTRFAALAVACLVLAASSADARPRHVSEQKVVCDKQGCRGAESYRRDNSNLTNRRIGMGSIGGCRISLGCGCNAAVRWLGLSAKEAGRQGYNMARAWLGKGAPAASDCIGCFMVSSRGKRGGHVGKVIGRDANGNPIVESYANARLGWTVATYPKSRVLGYVDMGWRMAMQ